MERTGENDASDFVDDALKVPKSAGTYEYPGYLSYKALNGWLCRSLAYVTPSNNGMIFMLIVAFGK